MSKQGKSAAGILFYTFATVLLLAVIIVCVLNFRQDSRLFQNRAEASVVKSSSQTEAIDTPAK